MEPEKMMKAVVLEGPRKFSIKKVPIPRPRDGEVLIKVMAAPLNPSDLIFLQRAEYSDNKRVPCTPGFQGSGIVVQNGGGIMGWSLTGKRVAFTPTDQTGSYAQFAIAESSRCLPIDDKLSFEHASMTFVNPLTALAMLEITQDKNVKSVIITAAASALGRMLNRLFRPENIQIINIVRREQQANILAKEGAKIILNSTDADFEAKLTKIAKDLKATICFQAIGGSATGQILKCMPPFSTAYVYGVLSGEHLKDIDIGDLLYSHKTVTGFFLPNWLHKKGMISLISLMRRLKNFMHRELSSEISERISIEEFEAGVDSYQKNMSKGKVVILPNNQHHKEEKSEVEREPEIKIAPKGKDVPKGNPQQPKSKQPQVKEQVGLPVQVDSQVVSVSKVETVKVESVQTIPSSVANKEEVPKEQPQQIILAPVVVTKQPDPVIHVLDDTHSAAKKSQETEAEKQTTEPAQREEATTQKKEEIPATTESKEEQKPQRVQQEYIQVQEPVTEEPSQQ